jgi:hypothetical protein
MATSSSSFSVNLTEKTNTVLTNDYVLAILSVVAVAYVSTSAPKLPHSIGNLMNNIVVKFLMFFIIAFIIVRKLEVALIASLAVLALVMALQVYNKEKMHGGLNNYLTSEPASISVDANGTYTETYPLGENWTQKVPKQVMGRKDDQWPTYEDPAKMPQQLSTCSWNGPQMNCNSESASPMDMPAGTHMAMPTGTHMAMPTESPMAMPTKARMAMPAESPMAMPTEYYMNMPAESPMAMPTEYYMNMPAESPMPTEYQMNMPAEYQMDMPAEYQMDMPAEYQMNMPAEYQMDMPAEYQMDMPAEYQMDMPVEQNMESFMNSIVASNDIFNDPNEDAEIQGIAPMYTSMSTLASI